MCYSYDDPCDACLGIPSDLEEQCMFCDQIDCICDELTDQYLESDLEL